VLADEAILILSQGVPFKGGSMCPVKVVSIVKKAEAKQVEKRGIPVEVIAGEPFARQNQPNHLKVNKDGSLYVCFGKRRRPDKKRRDYQFYVFLLHPAMEKRELSALVEAWYQLRSTEGCKHDFFKVNEQILNLLSHPARVEAKEDGFLLRAMEPF